MAKKITDPNYFSWWRYSLYKQCPHKYELICLGSEEVWEGSQNKDSRNALVGSVVHNSMEKIGQQFIRHEKPHINVKVEFNRFLDEKVVLLRENDTLTDLYQECKKYVQVALRLMAQYKMRDGELFVEQKLKAKIGNLSLGGRIDWDVRIAGKHNVYDWKVVDNPAYCEVNQLAFYNLLLEHNIHPHFRTPVNSSQFVLVKQGKLKGPYRITEARKQKLIILLQDFGNQIRAKKFEPNCNRFTCTYCNVKDFCDSFKVRFPTELSFDTEGEWTF